MNNGLTDQAFNNIDHLFTRIPALPSRADVHQGPGPRRGPDQAGHVPEVRA